MPQFKKLLESMRNVSINEGDIGDIQSDEVDPPFHVDDEVVIWYVERPDGMFDTVEVLDTEEAKKEMLDRLAADETVLRVYDMLTNVGLGAPIWERGAEETVTEDAGDAPADDAEIVVDTTPVEVKPEIELTQVDVASDAGDVPAATEPPHVDEQPAIDSTLNLVFAALINDEQEAVKGYDTALETVAVLKVDWLTDEKREALINGLTKLKNEELEHERTLHELAGLVEVPAENPVIKESEVLDDNAALRELLAGKKFDSFEDAEKFLQDKGFEVCEVYRAGEGFNVDLCKDGHEFFVPFIAIEGKFSAQLAEEKPAEELHEGILDSILAKISDISGLGKVTDMAGARENIMKFGEMIASNIDGLTVRNISEKELLLDNGDKQVVLEFEIEDDGGYRFTRVKGMKDGKVVFAESCREEDFESMHEWASRKIAEFFLK